MAEDKKILAKKAFELVRSALDGRKWTYKTDEEKLAFNFGVSGDDLPMDVIVKIDEDRQLIRLFSKFPFDIKEDKRLDAAVAVCMANYGMVDGGFDFDLGKGSILFRCVSTYRESQLSVELVNYLISLTCAMVDKYNDQFLALNKGVLSLQDFIANR